MPGYVDDGMIVLPAPVGRVRHGAARGLAELTVLRHRDLGLVDPIAVEIDLVFGLFVGAADPEFGPHGKLTSGDEDHFRSILGVYVPIAFLDDLRRIAGGSTDAAPSWAGSVYSDSKLTRMSISI